MQHFGASSFHAPARRPAQGGQPASGAAQYLVARQDAANALTKGQLEALFLLSIGLLQKQIARELEISESAVKSRLKGARVALRAKTINQAIALAWFYDVFRATAPEGARAQRAAEELLPRRHPSPSRESSPFSKQ